MRPVKAHLAFFTGAAPGHLNPALGVVRELVDRGHRVSYPTTAPFAPVVAAVGATPYVYRSTLPTDPRLWPADFAEVPLFLLADARAVAAEIEAWYGHDRPDVVVSEDPAGTGMVLAAKWSVPAVQMWPFLPTAEHWSARVARGGTPAERDGAHRYVSAVADFLAEHDIDRNAADHLSGGSRCHVVLIPRFLHPDPARLGNQFVFTGPCLRPDPARLDTSSWQPPAGGRPVLLISLGSLNTDHPGFYRACLDAFADAPWHVVMAVGRRVDPARFGTPPAHVELHRHVPQLAVLEHAAVFISHAGMGSVLESLYHGVPLVTVPYLPEQVDNARRIEALGLGRHLDPESVTPERLRAAVSGVAADHAIGERVADVRRRLRTLDAAAVAADAIEAQLD